MKIMSMKIRKILSIALTLVMLLGLFPGMSLTAYAADEVSENISLVNGQSLVLGTHYSVSGEFENESGIHVYNKDPMTINARKGETITKVVLTYSWGNYKSSLSASAGTFDGNATISDINAQQVTISSSNTAGVKISAVRVYFEGDLNNPTVTLTGGANAKSSGGLLTQSYLPGAMDTVTYTALTGATFPAFENFTQNGVTVERTSDTVVTVSGTPTANTEITVPDAESSSKMVTWGSSIINDSGRNGLEYQIRRNNSYSDTANGITLTKSGSGNVGSGWYTYGSLELNFTTATGKFTSIEIETSQIYDGGNWTKDGNTLKWNGTPSNSVSLSGSSLYLEGVSSINFVIEMPTVSVTITPGSNMTKTTDSGAAEQTGLTGSMTDVVYTADEGYYFPENYSVDAVNGISVTRNSCTQITVSGTPTADATITLTAPTAKTTPDAPTTAAAVNCTTASNNDGKLTGVTTAMEYQKQGDTEWTAGTGSDITGLVPGTYYVRVKATEMTNASTNQELTIKGFISYTVTFKVVNGKWNEGEDDAATAEKTVTLTGHDGDTLKLTADQIPAVGSKPNDTYKAGSWDTTPSAEIAITGATTYTYTYAQKESISRTVTFKVVNGSWNDETTTDKTVTLTGYEGDTLKLAADQIPTVGTKPNNTYKAGSWDVTPSTDTAITEATTYTYTYVAKEASVVTKAPEAKTLTYNGQAQALVTAGEATGGTMYYAVTTENVKPTDENLYTTSIPAKTNAGTYYVWYRAVGDNNHSDVEATCVSVDIEKAAITITADDKSSQKGAELQELSWQVSGDYVSGDELGISASTTADSSADAGVYPITVSWNDNANYEATLISGKYTITAPEESGRVETKTIVADNVPSCSISNLTTELARSLATEEELIRVQNGENLLIYLDMENIDDSVSATDKSLVEAAVKASSKDAKVGMYLDLTLYKKVGDGAATKVTDTKESRISVTIEVPDSLKGGSDVTRTFYIIRVHDGATDILATTTETTITFETDKFSTYALAYSDKSNGSPSVTTPAQQEKAPKTGDNFPSVWLWALILAGGLVPVGYAGGRHKGLERK